MLVYNCPELFHQITRIKLVNFDNYGMLHRDGKELIKSWFQRACSARNDSETFEPFIFAWFAFNGWASCVVDADKDSEFIEALISDARVYQDFESLVTGPDSATGIHVRKFAEYLPIFDVKKLKRRGISLRYHHRESRTDRIHHYFSNGAKEFEPRCWLRHIDSGESVPLDWAHVLKAIYKVRCNLFHGQKSAHSEMDGR